MAYGSSRRGGLARNNRGNVDHNLYGIGVILLNIGIYFVVPAVLVMKIRKRVNIEKLDKKYA